MSSESQTELCGCMNKSTISFNKHYSYKLTERCSFIVANTFVDDEFKIDVDRKTQSIEYGGLTCENSVQTDDIELCFTNIYPENVLSHTNVVKIEPPEKMDEDYDEDMETQTELFQCESESNTIITCTSQ